MSTVRLSIYAFIALLGLSVTVPAQRCATGLVNQRSHHRPKPARRADAQVVVYLRAGRPYGAVVNEGNGRWSEVQGRARYRFRETGRTASTIYLKKSDGLPVRLDLRRRAIDCRQGRWIKMYDIANAGSRMAPASKKRVCRSTGGMGITSALYANRLICGILLGVALRTPQSNHGPPVAPRAADPGGVPRARPVHGPLRRPPAPRARAPSGRARSRGRPGPGGR